MKRKNKNKDGWITAEDTIKYWDNWAVKIIEFLKKGEDNDKT